MFKSIFMSVLFSVSAFAGQLSVRVENQQIIAKACGLKSGTREVWFFVGKKGYAKNGVAQRESRFENGCAVKTYNNSTNDLFLKGGEVYASYDEMGKQPIQTNPDTVDIPWHDTSKPPVPTPTPTPGPTPGPAPTPNPPTDNRLEIDPKKVKNYAEQASRFFANRVVEIYGRVENYKYNFYIGFKRASSLYNNLGLSIQNLPQYGYGFQQGQQKGRNEGYYFGQQKGQQDGIAFGRQDAARRFQSAVNNESQLNVNMDAIPDGTQYPGNSVNLPVPDIRELLTGYNNDFYNEIRRENEFNSEVEFDSELSNNLYDRHIGLGDYYSWNDYKNEVLYSYWRGENALNLFLSKRLIKQSSVDYNKVKANNEMVAKYKEITDPTLYKDAEANRRIYRSTFIDVYDDVIDSKWNREVYQNSNPTAQRRGEYYFMQAIQAYAQNMGYREGYLNNYGPASVEGYRTTVGPAYSKSFQETVSFYTYNPVLDEVQLEITNQDGKNTFAVIDSVMATLNKVANFGKVPGKLSVQVLQNNGLNNGSNAVLEIEVPALTRLNSKRVLGALSQVSTFVKPDTRFEIQVKTNAGTQSATLNVSWSQTVKQITQDTAQRQTVLVQYLSQHLAKEMQDMISVFKKNRYKHEPQTTLAGKFVTTYASMTPQQQQVLNQHQSSIVAGIGPRPSGWFCFSCGKDEWDAAQLIFKQIGWSLPK